MWILIKVQRMYGITVRPTDVHIVLTDSQKLVLMKHCKENKQNAFNNWLLSPLANSKRYCKAAVYLVISSFPYKFST